MDGGDSRRWKMRPLDPLLLGAFPAPPTHIPPTPTSTEHPRQSGDDPRSSAVPMPPRRRTPSPDIAVMISATPRPRAGKRLPRRHSDLTASDDDDGCSWIDHDDLGWPRRPLHALDDSDSDASDSSLDLHTPLPHLMMRHGLLSPKSRLLTQPSARDSVVSLASTTTHPPKDSRDTLKRRVRHRDGHLLRGGIGLTTGLGWSDSEDEGAPSALTRRISSLNLTTRPSLPSLTPSRSTASLSSPPSRSSSSSTSDLRPSLPSRKSSSASSRPFSRSHSSISISDVDDFGRFTAPVLSIQTRSCSARPIPEGKEIDSTDAHTTRYTDGPAMCTPLPDIMTFAELQQREARYIREKCLPPLPRSSFVPDNGVQSMPSPRRMSSSSTDTRARSVSAASSASRGSTGSTQGSSSLVSVRATSTRTVSCAYNVPKSTSDTGAGTIKTPRRRLRLSTPTPTTTAPAPLLLAQRHPDRPAVPVPVPAPAPAPAPLATPALLDSRSSLPSTPSTPSPVTPGASDQPRPRPRVGTGMTYRSSVSRIRVPSGIVGPTQKPVPF